jgi:phospholipid/cholesterol/gamma-HCH transport system permease protein
MITSYITRFGDYFISIIEQMGEIGLFIYSSIVASVTRPFNFRLVLEQIDEIGFKSIPIVIASSMAIGMVMVVQLAWGFAWFGAKGIVGPVVALSFVRELGPVVTSLLVGGRVGSGITAEIGSMKVTEQIDAIRTLGADPIRKLVVPRLIASIIAFPFLTVIADFTGILGSLIISMLDLDVQPRLFISSILEWVTISDFISGIAKTFFFGIIVAITGCYIGMRADGGTQGVGRATTQTVVVSLLLIIIGDFLLTKLFLLLP